MLALADSFFEDADFIERVFLACERHPPTLVIAALILPRLNHGTIATTHDDRIAAMRVVHRIAETLWSFACNAPRPQRRHRLDIARRCGSASFTAAVVRHVLATRQINEIGVRLLWDFDDAKK